jgi:hypothetical protein
MGRSPISQDGYFRIYLIPPLVLLCCRGRGRVTSLDSENAGSAWDEGTLEYVEAGLA